MPRNAGFARRVLASSRLNSSAVATTATNNFTCAVWARVFGWSNQTSLIYNGNGGSSGWGLTLDNSNGISGLFGGVVFGSSVVIPTGTWFHALLMRNAGTAQVVVNGYRYSSTWANSPNTPAGSVHIGSSAPGSIIELRDPAIWDVVLPRDERIALARGVRPDQLGRPMKAYYPLQNDLLDYSGNGLHLTETGTTYRVPAVDSELTQGLEPMDIPLSESMGYFYTGVMQIPQIVSPL